MPSLIPSKLPAFKAYDVRGPVPAQLHIDMVYAIGRAYARVMKPTGSVALCRDIRDSSADFCRALAAGLNAEGVATRDLGLGGTELTYYAAGQAGMGGGIMITASHNPVGDNGIKMVRVEAKPISASDGLGEIEALTRELLQAQAEALGQGEGYGYGPLTDGAQYHTRPDLHAEVDWHDDYVNCVRGFVDFPALQAALSAKAAQGRRLKVVVNAGNGCAGPTFDRIAQGLDLDIVRVFHEPDGQFPNGVPNPMLAKCQEVTARVVRAEQADLGIAWDGDFDRCFFFDETGAFIEGYYLVGLFAEQLIRHEPGATVCHDTRLTWNTQAAAARAGGHAVMSECGHSYIKAALRRTGAVYGGEMSAHHYFRDFFCCDSGMIPWLLVLERLLQGEESLSSLVQAAQSAFPCSGEINFKVTDAPATLQRVRAAVLAEVAAGREQLLAEHELDGVTREFPQWRFNVRMSNTEPVVRLNVEARADVALMRERTRWLTELIHA